MPLDAALRERREDRLGGVGRRRDRHAERHDEGDLGALAQAPLGEEVVHQQGRLARRRRALERRRRDADDDPSALERLEDVAAGERPGHGVELVARLDQARRRRRVEVGAEGDDHHVALERAGVGLDPPRRGVDRADRRSARSARPA